MEKILRFCVTCSVIVIVTSMEKTQMYMKRSEVSDQSMSGSGYSFNVHGATPEEFEFKTDDESKALKILRELGYDPFADLSRYADEHLPLHYEQYYKGYEPAANNHPINFEVNHENYYIPKPKAYYGSYSPLDSYEKITYPPIYPYAHGYGHDSHDVGKFLKKGGKYYLTDDASKRGEKFDAGYNKVDAFDKALKGSFENKDSKSYYGQKGKNKQSQYDNADNYAVNNAASKVSVGGSFGQKDGHNKGSKTTGYHKVYHKDDYNKQHKFYDKADKKGHFSKYGDYNAKHGNQQGYFVNGGNAQEGYDNDKYGAKGVSDKGHFEDVAKGFKSADGKEGFYQNYAGFSKKDGQESGSIGGYSS